ncbi:MAG: phosphate acyltransferase PlsX [Chloroflexi bacterium]|nr:phosphate acyltransferase PlsX [Chloroflexota bacterium]
MRIVVDAMGSDNHPAPDVAGAVEAAREFGDEIILVGDQKLLEAELAKHNLTNARVTIKHASQAVTMEDKPRDVVRGKPDSSMHVGMNLVKEGAADAFVTAGNTGGALAIAMLGTLRRLPSIKRPALGILFPTPGHPLLIDNGANTDCDPENLLQFAQMGSIYVSRMNGIQQPRIALISNGEEDGKGNALIQATIPLLRESGLNYIGNIEPKEFLQGHADVGVTDGFVGNVLMKTVEATAKMLMEALRTELKAGVLSSLGGLLARPAFRRVGKILNPDEIGGAPLLGVKGVVIVAHGRSNAYAMKQAIGQARRIVEAKVLDALAEL